MSLNQLPTNQNYSILHNDYLDSVIKIGEIEKRYNVSYVGEFSLNNKVSGWLNTPVQIYYQKEPHPRGSNYLAVLFNVFGDLTVADGISATETPWNAVLDTETNKVIYSAFRHDYQVLDGVMVDGGQEYFKRSMTEKHKPVQLIIKNGKVEVRDETIENSREAVENSN